MRNYTPFVKISSISGTSSRSWLETISFAFFSFSFLSYSRSCLPSKRAKSTRNHLLHRLKNSTSQSWYSSESRFVLEEKNSRRHLAGNLLPPPEKNGIVATGKRESSRHSRRRRINNYSCGFGVAVSQRTRPVTRLSPRLVLLITNVGAVVCPPPSPQLFFSSSPRTRCHHPPSRGRSSSRIGPFFH